jgi:hypothetical protein
MGHDPRRVVCNSVCQTASLQRLITYADCISQLNWPDTSVCKKDSSHRISSQLPKVEKSRIVEKVFSVNVQKDSFQLSCVLGEKS